MGKQNITTLHIRDAVSKTFHIADDEIILHVDTNGVPIKVDEKFRSDVELLVKVARAHADDIIVMEEINVHGEADDVLGDLAQTLWEDSIINK